MATVRPFRALCPGPGRAFEVVAPPYDVVSAREAWDRAVMRPWSFLHVSRAEIDLPPGTDPYGPQVYQKAVKQLAKMTDQKVLVRDQEPYYYIYRLQQGSHVQTGIALTASIDEYRKGIIRRHELTRPDKEDDRVRHILSVNAQTGPVLLACRSHARLATLMEQLTQRDPDANAWADDQVKHFLWVVKDPKAIQEITDCFAEMPSLYIADGHHRAAAASRVAERRQRFNDKPTGHESYNYLMAVVFPEDQLRILDYNRVVKDLNNLTPENFLNRVNQQGFSVTPMAEPTPPQKPGEMGLYLAKQWYSLVMAADKIPHQDPVKRLDVSLLTDMILQPILGIEDLRRDPRIDFVGGSRGLAGLMDRVESGEMAAAFAMYPTQLTDLMAVADANQLMPPKSTWFEPKLADGLVSHVLD